MTQEARTTVETPQLQSSDGVVVVPVVMPRQVPTIQRVQHTEDVPQMQCSDIVVHHSICADNRRGDTDTAH